ncbi:hypothetical protein [Shewanella sp.]|uniref:hypothetical protein n=1 Tax=Shewanella sp. TaxID=50422 RepID=UPI003A8B0E39
MSIIHSIAHQWDKAEFAHQLEQYLAPNRDAMRLFVGATRSQTVCHLIAAMGELPPKSEEGDFNITLPLLLDVLLQRFLLLYVKEVQHQSLTQGEQLIVSLTELIAQQAKQQDEQDAEVLSKSHIILSAMEKLEKHRTQLRRQRSNMGRS